MLLLKGGWERPACKVHAIMLPVQTSRSRFGLDRHRHDSPTAAAHNKVVCWARGCTAFSVLIPAWSRVNRPSWLFSMESLNHGWAVVVLRHSVTEGIHSCDAPYMTTSRATLIHLALLSTHTHTDTQIKYTCIFKAWYLIIRTDVQSVYAYAYPRCFLSLTHTLTYTHRQLPKCTVSQGFGGEEVWKDEIW